MTMQKKLQDLREYANAILPLDEFPERDEEITRIFLDLLDIPRYELSLYKNQDVSSIEESFCQIISQRKTHKPLAYILGYSYFYGEKFPVSEETLIPRYDTEILVETITKHYDKEQEFRVLDICTGTGIIALTLARLFDKAIIKATDIVETPFYNSLQYHKYDVDFQRGDFLDKSTWSGEWDCIVSNPPYLDEKDMLALSKQVKDFEPSRALFAEEDGLIFYRYIAEFADKHLAKKGKIFLEIDHKYPKIIKIFNKYKNPTIINDLSGLPRVLVLES